MTGVDILSAAVLLLLVACAVGTWLGSMEHCSCGPQPRAQGVSYMDIGCPIHGAWPSDE